MSNSKTDPHRLPSVAGAEEKQARKAQYIPIPGWGLAVIAAIVIVVVLLAGLG